eukprot:TRINITY_DN1893_c0_g1_i2.p1 TRINITY_DN1893_c0_g1~~TRINITY_DN1893_c0_g1_i2.p1  ORF type:complete len:436 (-),score=81.47 TRINITY_DN1893_c0_g1_i2:2-1246(-)
MPAALSNGLMKYWEWYLVIQLRKRLQQHIHNLYFDHDQFYKVNTTKNQIEHIDQRITDDIATFTHDIIHVYGHVMKPMVDILFLFNTLRRRIGLEQVLGYVSFFFVASKATSLFKANFAQLAMLKQETEGQFRTQHSHVINYSEEIAFLRGGEQEKLISNLLFDVLANQEQYRRLKLLFANILDSYVLKYGAAMVAYSVLIPSTYFGSEDNQQIITSRYLSSTSLLLALGKAMQDITMQYKRLAKVKGMTNRIYEVVDKLSYQTYSKVSSLKNHSESDSTAIQKISVKNVDIVVPSNSSFNIPRTLIKNLSLQVDQEDHLLLTGGNGTGKTTLFRLLAGLRNTQGVLVPDDMMFVPQKSYMTAGTLLSQITYPQQAYTTCPIPSAVGMPTLTDRMNSSSVVNGRSSETAKAHRG